MSFEPHRIVHHSGQSKELRLPGHPIIVPKLLSADTGGAYSLLEMTLGDEGPPLHIHQSEEEAFYILEGMVQVRMGAEIVEVSSGSLVLVPRGTPHTFWNGGTEPARLLVIFSPGGYEGFFLEAAQITPAPGTPEYLDEINRLRISHGAELAE